MVGDEAKQGDSGVEGEEDRASSPEGTARVSGAEAESRSYARTIEP